MGEFRGSLLLQAEAVAKSYEGMRDTAPLAGEEGYAQRMNFVGAAEIHTTAISAAVGAAVFELEMAERYAAGIQCDSNAPACPRLEFLLQAAEQIATVARDDAAQLRNDKPRP
jgi:hypothetical protein